MPNGGTLTIETGRALVKEHAANVPFHPKNGDCRPGHGTTVKISLPRLSDEVLVQEVNRAEAEQGGKRSENVLLVEDSEDVRGFAADSLRHYGFNVLEASDASGRCASSKATVE
jgi:hypothetical protein